MLRGKYALAKMVFIKKKDRRLLSFGKGPADEVTIAFTCQ